MGHPSLEVSCISLDVYIDCNICLSCNFAILIFQEFLDIMPYQFHKLSRTGETFDILSFRKGVTLNRSKNMSY